MIGYGSAAIPAITGESQKSIIEAIQTFIAPKLLHQPVDHFNQLLHSTQTALKRNPSAKAAVDIALHDLFAQYCQIPLYKFLGGSSRKISTCITISVKDSAAWPRMLNYLSSKDLIPIRCTHFIEPRANPHIEAQIFVIPAA